MRVLFINQFYYPDEAATAQLLTDLTQDLVGKGFEVVVVAGTGRYLGGRSSLPLYEVHRGVTIYRVPTTGFGRGSPVGRIADYLAFYLGALLRVLMLPRFQTTVIMSTPPLISLLGPVTRLAKGSRFIYWVQDIYPDLLIALGRMKGTGWLARVLGVVSRFSLRQADRAIVLGERMRERVIEKGVDPRRILVIHNWADGKALFPDRIAGRSFADRHELDGGFQIIYSGNLGNSHHFETFLAAAKELRGDSTIKFLFIGDGPQKRHVEQSCRGMGLPNVRFLPYQPRAALRGSLNSAGVHLISLMPGLEGLMVPSKIYGVMAVGKPVVFVGPEESEVAEIIRRAGCGFVVRPGDTNSLVRSCLQLLADQKLREGLGAAGRRYFCDEFEREKASARFSDVFRSTRAPAIGLSGILRPFTRDRAAFGLRRMIKRLFDVSVASAVLVLGAPILGFIGLAIKLEDGGSVFFVQERVGKRGIRFRCYKFRSMVVGAEERGLGGEVGEDDDRLTRMGRVLRSWTLDEMPQLVNILKGDMSVVGPRPWIAKQADGCFEWARRRFDMKPGLAGWAWIHGRNLVPWEDRLHMDVWYVENWSLRLDAYILAKAFILLFKRQGVYGPGGVARDPSWVVPVGTTDYRPQDH